MTHEQLREALRDLEYINLAMHEQATRPMHTPSAVSVFKWSERLRAVREALAALDREGAGVVERETFEAFCLRLQQRCVDWGAYWRASDDHGVTLTSEQAIDLLRDVLGVDIEIKSATPPAAEREGADADEEGTYKIGYRDGYEDAVQDIDVLTGGDGEYRYCTDHDPDRHTPDAAAMKRRIEERFDALQAAQPAQQDEARWRNEMDALMVAMQRASEALFAATRDGQKIETAVQYEQLAVALYTLNAAIDKQRAGGGS